MNKSNTSLFLILKKFSHSEIKEFDEFVNSPFFNKNLKTIEFFNLLKKYYPDFDHKNLDNKHLFKKLSGNEKYNDGFIRMLNHNLINLTKEYMIYKNNTRDEVNKGLSLLEELNNKQLDKQFQKTFKILERSLTSAVIKDSDHYYKKYKLESLMFIHQIINRHNTKDENFLELNRIMGEFKYLTAFYMINALGLYRFLAYEGEYVQKHDFDGDFGNHLLDYLVKNDNIYKNIPHIELHQNEILLIKDKCEASFGKLKKIFIENKLGLSHNERFSLHSILQEFARSRHTSENINNSRERFELFRIALDQRLYSVEGDAYMDDKFFEIILGISISLKEFRWSQDFIEKYKDLLSPKNSDTVVNIANAKLAFANGDFSKSLYFLNQTGVIRDVQYKLVVKNMLLMTYYELTMYEQAYYLLDSFRHFISNNRESFSGNDIERNENFRKFLLKLIRLREGIKNGGPEALQSEINKTPLIVHKKWLEEKLTEFHNNVKSSA